jgi:peptidoglycan hydrolase-like protein with peptidoglycan-binding domain
MALQSQLFRGDAKLEAAAVSDPAHIVPGARGEHVRKIQLALIQLDEAVIDPDGIYGPATAAAVFAYKNKRNIVNRSYQTQADNIVGKMTMALLDAELLSKEVVPSGPTRFETLSPEQPSSRPSELLPKSMSRLQLSFAMNVPFADAISLPPFVTLTPSLLEVSRNQVGLFRVLNGVGKELVCQNSSIATIAPLDLPSNANTLTTIKIREKNQSIRVFPKNEGWTTISLRPFDIFDPFMTIIVRAEVKIFFHFLDGLQGVKTVRKETDLSAILKTMNDIYQRNHAGMVFVNNGVNPRLQIAGLGGGTPGVRVNQFGSTSDTDAIKANYKSDILFNVFFVGNFTDVSNIDATVTNFLALTSRPPNDNKPLRCCLCRDAQTGDPPGIDPGKTLAHEAGHALGEDDDNSDRNSLMFFSQSGQTDTRIDAGMAGRMMSSFRQFPP